MYQNPTLFPAISNRQSWRQVVELADDDTGDLILLTDESGAALYAIALEITASNPTSHWQRSTYPSSYDGGCDPSISASLSDYISIVGTGTIQISIPKSVIATLSPQTYDVFMTITDTAEDDARQILIGRLPVLYGGRST